MQLFRSIDKGNTKRGINAYNGGLFAPDKEVDNLDLDDRWTEFFRDVGRYDFHDEVNVDVLGRHFEQSITDIEAIRADPKPAQKVSGKRKREGIYYTPPHITEYIVEHTLGACLEERFDKLAAEFEVEPDAEPSPKSLARWIRYNEARLEALRSLRVCDPACGSGAFLIQAFDYLEDAYHDVVDALCLRQGEHNEKLREQIARDILRNNLYGVDLSQEAVEITRLALWIRTARRGQSLADLSDNILCGNSLVDDPDVDPGAFVWERRFAGVFDRGGFDCVISNPPYI